VCAIFGAECGARPIGRYDAVTLKRKETVPQHAMKALGGEEI
jgi:hypothetical protein